MKIFKFGGASVKDADGVKNLLNVVNKKADKKHNYCCFSNG
ncbi:MAG: hypothetical protein CM15mP102_13900 [Flavobacteriales bacterium]|nr:MAG: hypothetical protein CM15mP102_13900 [Flavobacteriales bacterium]